MDDCDLQEDLRINEYRTHSQVEQTAEEFWE